MKLTKEQTDLFVNVLKFNTVDDLPLAEELETGIIYRMIRYRYYSRGCEDLRFFIKQNEEGNLFLDYYFSTDDYSMHYRIDHTGAKIKLESWEGDFGWPIYEDKKATKKEHDRMKANNIMVGAILQQKSLDGFDEHGYLLFQSSARGTEWYTETRKLSS